MKIYIAAPISGMTNEAVFNYFQGASSRLGHMGYEVLSPLSAKGYFRTEKHKHYVFQGQGYTYPTSTDHAIYTRDKWMVSLCDVVYANLTFRDGGEKVSIGTIHEMAWGALLGKHVVVAMGESNPHIHAFVLEDASILLPTHTEAMQYLEKLITNAV